MVDVPRPYPSFAPLVPCARGLVPCGTLRNCRNCLGAPHCKLARSLPAEQQGMVVLGTPLVSDAFVDAFLQTKAGVHTSLLSKIPAALDVQAARLLLLRRLAAPKPRNTCATPGDSASGGKPPLGGNSGLNGGRRNRELRVLVPKQTCGPL